MKRTLFLLLAIIAATSCQIVRCQLPNAPFVTISGKVKDAKNKKPLPNSTITLEGSNIGTVSNAEGAFSLTFPDSLKNHNVSISHLGYDNASIPADKWSRAYIVMLGKSTKQLDEVVVYGGNPRIIVEAALDKISDNYPRSTDRLSVFYRETIQKGKRYTEVSEGVMDVVKTPYRRRYAGNDKVQVLKGRKLMSQKSSDTLAIKVIGGPNLSVALDFVKNPDFFLSPTELDAYEFKMEPSIIYDDRRQYVISFRPIGKLDYPLMKGVVYIDAELLAFTRAELDLDMSDRELVVRTMLRKKPAGLKFNPQNVRFTVAYRQNDDGTSYLSYILNEMKFKCDWKRRLFSSGYTAIAEMVVVDREEATPNSISRQQAFKPRETFSDIATQYWDEDFWEGYNIIEPTESLEKAVDKLKKNQKH